MAFLFESIESRQKYISFIMKKHGVHWSAAGAESMVKVKQGIFNGTLREFINGVKAKQKRTA